MLRNSRHIDTFHFSDLRALRDWLNRFSEETIRTVDPEGADWFKLEWYEETLSDGSTVHNARITTE